MRICCVRSLRSTPAPFKSRRLQEPVGGAVILQNATKISKIEIETEEVCGNNTASRLLDFSLDVDVLPCEQLLLTPLQRHAHRVSSRHKCFAQTGRVKRLRDAHCKLEQSGHWKRGGAGGDYAKVADGVDDA